MCSFLCPELKVVVTPNSSTQTINMEGFLQRIISIVKYILTCCNLKKNQLLYFYSVVNCNELIHPFSVYHLKICGLLLMNFV